MKTITICGSMKFFDEIKELKRVLEKKGFSVFIPSEEGTDIDYSQLSKQEQIELKKGFIDRHIEKIKVSDAILIANYTKNNIKDYVGANSFLEMAFAYILQKNIFVLYDIPEQSNAVEIEGMKPIILHGNIDLLEEER